MVYAIEDIARTLKEARETKGLSQRALSARVGLTQAHISNIENAATDLHLSNLMELARALDLEVMLVPRKAVPAAQGLLRNIETSAPSPADPSNAMRGLVHSIERLGTLYPDAKDVPKLRNLAAAFRNFCLNTEQAQTINSAARELQRISDTLQKGKVPDLTASSADMQRVSRLAGAYSSR